VPLDPRMLEIVGADAYLNRLYRSGGTLAALYIGYYRSQREGDAIHSPMNCLPGAGWQAVSSERTSLVVSNSERWPVNQVVIEKAGERQLAVYWYQTSRRVVASEYWSKFFLVSDAMTSRRTDAALVRLVTPIEQNQDADRAFSLKRVLPLARAVLPIVRSQLFL